MVAARATFIRSSYLLDGRPLQGHSRYMNADLLGITHNNYRGLLMRSNAINHASAVMQY